MGSVYFLIFMTDLTVVDRLKFKKSQLFLTKEWLPKGKIQGAF